MRILTNVNINWLRWRWHALIFSWVIILAGVALIATRGLPLGIDFSGGTLVILKFEKPVSEDAVRQALETSVPGEKVVQQYGDAGENQMLIRLPQATEAEQGFKLEEGVTRLVGALQKGNIGKFEVLSTEVVGPVIGRDLQRKGIYATIASLLGIMTYIAFRFRFSFGVGAMVASVHDVLVTLSVLTFCRLRAVAERRRRDPHARRLRRERPDRDLRPRPREPAQATPRAARDRHQREREPDAAADHHHRRHDVPLGAGAVSVRRRGARRASPSRCSSASSRARIRRCSSPRRLR